MQVRYRILFHNTPHKNEDLKQRCGGLACTVSIRVAPVGVTRPNLAVSWAGLEGPRKLHSQVCVLLFVQAVAHSPRGKLKLLHSPVDSGESDPSYGGCLLKAGSKCYQSSHGLGSKPQNSSSLNFIVHSKSQRQCDSMHRK